MGLDISEDEVLHLGLKFHHEHMILNIARVQLFQQLGNCLLFVNFQEGARTTHTLTLSRHFRTVEI